MEKGLLLPLPAVIVVLVPLISSMYLDRLHPVVICGALAGFLACPPALNAVVAGAGSKTPVLGYTVPYAIANESSSKPSNSTISSVYNRGSLAQH
jgi:putative transport protein